MTRLTVRRAIAATLAVLAGVAGSALGAAPAQADPVRQYQWYLNPLKIAQAQQVTKGAGVVIAVVDSPIWSGQRDLAGQLLEGTSTNGGPANGWGPDNADSAHGTEVATVIAGKGGGDDRMLGIAPAAKLLPVAASTGLSGTPRTISAGIRWAADHGAKVINLSNGHNGKATAEEVEAIRYAVSKDIVVVAGVGNTDEGMRDVIAPANIPGVIAVSGVDQNGDFWDGSASGPETVLAAPGSQMSVGSVTGTYKTAYGLAAGTSLATAIVSGVVALVRSKYPQLDAANVINRLVKTAKDNGDPGRDKYFGFGTVRPLDALTADVPAVTENPLGAVPAAAPGASAGPTEVPKSKADMGKVAFLIAIPVVLVLALVVTLIVVARSSARRRRAAAQAYPAPPPGYPPPPPPGYPPPPGNTNQWTRQ
ncbi:S8 family serine peptidase [Dactylosporangium sp. CS-033363]|uniref:S8 family serine peptidase n=1 Tax=Dactylosporangium sp. CS-033363 TaxID=3239935 RepID=UPI003D8C8AD3